MFCGLLADWEAWRLFLERASFAPRATNLTGVPPVLDACTMTSMISSPSDVTVSKIEFGPVKLLDSGGKTVNLRYESRNLMLETPSMSVPYGVNVFDKTGPAKYSVDLSLRGADDSEPIRALQNFLEAFDERMIDAGVENAGKWFKMANPSREVIKAFYTPLLKYSRDPQGNLKPYPPTIKLALRQKKGLTGSQTSSFETCFYNAAEKDTSGKVSEFPRDSALEQVLCKWSNVTAIVQCTGIWFAGGKFGTTWKAVQMRVDSQPDQIRGPAFRSDAPDIRAFVSKKAVAAAVEDVEDEDEEDEAVAAVLPPKKAAVAVAASTFEDEAVAEPLPVPKKVVKKMVAKTK